MELPEKAYLLSYGGTTITEAILTWDQVVFTIVIMLPTITAGMTVGIAAIALPELNFNTSQEAWFTSLPTLSATLSILLSGLILDKCGRKMALIFTSVNVIIGFILTSISSSIFCLFMGQFFCGLSQGFMTLPPTIYVAESIAPNNIKTRSSLTSWIVLAVNLGICLDYALGPFLYFTSIAILGAALGFFSLIMIMIFIPESPAWLCQKGRYAAAASARKRLSFQIDSLRNQSWKLPLDDLVEEHVSFKTYLNSITRKDVYKPLIITTIFLFFMNFTGQLVYTVHMVDIISVHNVAANPYYMTLVCGIFILTSQIIYIFSAPHAGVKKTCIIAVVGTGLSNAILASTISLNETTNSFAQIIDYVHILSVWMFVLLSGPISTVPFTIVGELFPAGLKGFGSIPFILNSLFYFAILWIYTYSMQWSQYFIYYFFTFMSVLAAIYIHLYVPETVGKTIKEITNQFM